MCMYEEKYIDVGVAEDIFQLLLLHLKVMGYQWDKVSQKGKYNKHVLQ